MAAGRLLPPGRSSGMRLMFLSRNSVRCFIHTKTNIMDSIQSKHEFEKKIFDLVMDFYEGKLPQTIYLAINRNDLSLVLITSLKSASGLAGQQGWIIASIPPENFSDNVAELASTFFDVR